MIRIKEAIVVEGRYDKSTLCRIVDAVVVETGGFRIFSDGEKLDLLRRLAESRGLIILTDSDGAGLVIRNYLRGALPADRVRHAYIPDIPGKERRKRQPGREGKLGVEGMERETILRALRLAGATWEEEQSRDTITKEGQRPIRKADLYEAGLWGGAGSAARRKELLHRLKLPEYLSANALTEVLNALFTWEEFQREVTGC